MFPLQKILSNLNISKLTSKIHIGSIQKGGANVVSATDNISTIIGEMGVEKLSVLPFEKLQEARELILKYSFGCVDDVIKIVNLDEKAKTRAYYLMDELSINDSFRIFKIASFNDKQYQMALDLLNKGQNASNACWIAYDEETYTRACDLIKRGHKSSLYEIVKDVTRYERTVEIEEKYKKELGDAIRSAVYLDEKKYRQLLEFTQRKGLGAVAGNNTYYTCFMNLDVDIDECIRLYDYMVSKNLNASNTTSIIKIKNTIENSTYDTSFKDKVKGIEKESKLTPDDYSAFREVFGYDLKDSLEKFKASLGHIISPYDVSKETLQKAFKGFFSNKKSTENIIRNAPIESFASGLPLVYSREKFLSDLEEILKNVSFDKKNEILSKLKIQLLESNSKITGYNGIINFDSLDKTDEIEQKIYNIVDNFINKNKVITGNQEFDESMNSFLGAFGEFINIIGKKQHNEHKYSLDIHILKVLKEGMKNPEYEKLSPLDKTAFKLSAIFHDILKTEGKVDNMHPKASAICAKDILDKTNLPDDVKDRVYELIKNHHWLEKYAKGEPLGKSISPQDQEKYIATFFRRPNDFEIAKIFADADLKGVSDEFYTRHFESLKKVSSKKISDKFAQLYSTGQLVFTDKIVYPKRVPIVEYKGKKIKVINFSQMSDNYDLSQVGFMEGLTPKDLRLLLHMVEAPSDISKALNLQNIANEGYLCTSYITLDKKPTLFCRQFGVSIDAQNTDISTAYNRDQGSKNKKNFDSFCQETFREANNNSIFREFIPDLLKKIFKINNDEYMDLYKRLAPKKYLSSINDKDVFVLKNREIKGDEVKRVIKEANDSLIVHRGENLALGNNEVNVYNPKINAFVAMVDNIEEIPDEYINIASDSDKVIYILGKNF